MKKLKEKHFIFIGHLFVLLTNTISLQTIDLKAIVEKYGQEVVDLHTKAILNTYFFWGTQFFNKGNMDLAIKHYKCAEESDFNPAITYYMIGLCNEKKGDMLRAREHFKIASHLKPDFIDALMHWGMNEYSMCQIPAAIEIFNTALSINPNNAYLHYQTGLVYELQDKFDKAVEAFSKAHELKPTSITYIAELASALALINKNDRAILLCQRALELDPSLSNISQAWDKPYFLMVIMNRHLRYLTRS